MAAPFGVNLNRLERYLSHCYGVKIEYHTDIVTLRQEIPEIQELNDGVVQNLYHNWSEYAYDASWMNLSKDNITEFRGFLLGGYNDISQTALNWVRDPMYFNYDF